METPDVFCTSKSLSCLHTLFHSVSLAHHLHVSVQCVGRHATAVAKKKKKSNTSFDFFYSYDRLLSKCQSIEKQISVVVIFYLLTFWGILPKHSTFPVHPLKLKKQRISYILSNATQTGYALCGAPLPFAGFLLAGVLNILPAQRGLCHSESR